MSSCVVGKNNFFLSGHLLSTGEKDAATYVREKYHIEETITLEIANDLIKTFGAHQIGLMFQNNVQFKFENTEVMMLFHWIECLLGVIFDNHSDELDLYLGALVNKKPLTSDKILQTYLIHRNRKNELLETIMKYATINESYTIYYHDLKSIDVLLSLNYDRIIKCLRPSVELAQLLKEHNLDLNLFNLKGAPDEELIIFLGNEDYDFKPIFDHIEKSDSIMYYSIDVCKVLIKKGFNVNTLRNVSLIMQSKDPKKICLFLDAEMDPRIYLDATPINPDWVAINSRLHAFGVSYSDVAERTQNYSVHMFDSLPSSKAK